VAPTNYLFTNWSGYVANGGPFTSVDGTFAVPEIEDSASCGEDVDNWVGIDGAHNASLIQAGVNENMTNPLTGVCTPGQFWVWSWWEILPAMATVTPDIGILPGNTVTVKIWQTSIDAWSIFIRNDTTGQSFSTQQFYNGPEASAEWITEAPSGPLCGGHCDLAPYSPVTFTNLSKTGAATGWEDWSMFQFGLQVSTPVPLDAGSFTNTYDYF
jgi:hypothetical protein